MLAAADRTNVKSTMKGAPVFVFLLIWSFTITVVSSNPALLLTPYILKNQTDLARNLSKVNPELFLNVTSYSGYLTVDQKYNSNLFFWYFPVKDQVVSADTPWIIWLQGGPGSTSLAGLFVELGPFSYDPVKGLQPRESTWNQKYALLFIDNPVGAGYSFTDSPDGFVHSMDDCSDHLYKALQQFLEVFPERRNSPLYLAGESYAGHYVPAFGHKILHPPPMPDLKLKSTSVNLKGIILGNPVIDRRDILNMSSIYYQWGLIDSQGVEAVRSLQEKYAEAVQENNNERAVDYHDKLWDALEKSASQAQSYNVMKGEIHEISAFQDFIVKAETKDAIHVGDIGFTFSNSTVHTTLIKDYVVSLNDKVEELLERSRVLIYCGQLDLVAPCVMNAEGRRKTWRWKGRAAFLKAPRVPWWHGGIAGYVKSGGNFTEVLVRGAGHLVPMDKPAETFELIDYFIRGLEIPVPSNYVIEETQPYVDVPVPVKGPNSPSESSSNGFIISIALNVIFASIIVVGLILGIRWKRRADTYFYSMVDNASLNGVLTMD